MPPDFILAGMMKAGTTTLYRWLESHPSIEPCRVKEPHFFSDRWDRGLDWYSSLFPRVEEGALTFEASQSYTHPDRAARVACRVRDTLPHVRLVFVLRHPLTRARSEYRHQVLRGRESRMFQEAIGDPAAPYLRRSMYRTCLDPFLSTFPADRLTFLRFEDLTSADETEWLRLLSVLDLGRVERPVVRVQSTRSGAGWRSITRRLVDLGAAPFGKRLPRRLRNLLRPLFLQASPSLRARLESAKADVSAHLAQAVWEDVSRMEEWLGGSRWWERGV